MPGQTLAVWLGDREVGTLERTRRGARFAYNAQIADEMTGRPLLSLSLPVKKRAYHEGRTASWFEGLLPEGDRLDAVCRNLGCDQGDYMSILEHIGWECAGAVSIRLPSAGMPAATSPTVLTTADLAHKIRELPTYGGVDPSARVSLGGYQEKLLVLAHDLVVEHGFVTKASWSMPGTMSVTTHIIKPQPEGRYPHIAEAEAWAMHVARSAARCADVALLALDDAPPSLVVTRFDRAMVNGVRVRVHQEDGCQAMGLAPHQKYASTTAPKGDDPTYIKLARLLEAYAQDPEAELVELLRQMAVNLVLGNVDAHAKNYAFLYHQVAAPKVAPLYDVVPVADIEPRAAFLSMRVGGGIRFADVGRQEILREAQSWGLTSKKAGHVVNETLERVREGIRQTEDLYPLAAARHADGALRRLAWYAG